ncbi:hypothetical protein [Streptomyces albidoflavus]|uniref:hypothetical protein n=1 Tax=Streptomyces albidoflavus TaxID=1886 RepID=UPI00101E62D6|nr:hypothetical protein [Streptomyces albidoflavus]RZD80149.1 hypothetical protein C0Q60_15535 [Streptomyces albidoflavus]RZD97166.1 hypothetical protein C0Q62_15415 [Streptomyces albidoflavus]
MNHAQMVALGRMLRVLGESGDELRGDTPEEALHEIRADLKRALDLLEESTGPAPTTRCSQHPYGPVDKAAPDGCLLCETRRRSNHRSAYRDRWGGAPADEAGDRPMPVPSRYGIAADTPEPMVRLRPEAWSGQAWQLCGTPRRDQREAELFLAACRRKADRAAAYRLVRESTSFEVVRMWGEPIVVRPETGGGL